ncbi:MAG: nucleotidyltransferase domain-containing protein [Nanoarchaeota archaeon]
MFQEILELDIVLELEIKSTHIRDLALKVNSSPATVMRKLNNLKNNNIVDLINEGKNDRYFLKNTFEAQNYLLMGQIYKLNKFIFENPKLKLMLFEIKNILDGELAILFGSYVKGLQNKNSDIDLFIETNNENLKRKIEMINSNLNVKIGTFNKNSFLGKEIIKNKIIISGFEIYYGAIKE